MQRRRRRRQFPRQLHGGRARRGDARLPPLGRAHHRAPGARLHADARHLQAGEEGEAELPATPHGGRSARQPRARDGARQRKVPRVRRGEGGIRGVGRGGGIRGVGSGGGIRGVGSGSAGHRLVEMRWGPSTLSSSGEDEGREGIRGVGMEGH